MQNAVAVSSTPIPTSIEQLWGTPSLLPGENEAAYKALWMDIAKDIEPSDVIEWLRRRCAIHGWITTAR
jgi:hypothetical protein